MTAYKSFKEALAGQKAISSKIREKDHALPLKDADRARQALRIEEIITNTDPRTEAVIASRLRRSAR